jgi:hypothetical protein
MAIERNFVLARMKRVVSETGSMADCARMFIVVESLVAIDPGLAGVAAWLAEDYGLADRWSNHMRARLRPVCTDSRRKQ